jgi:hypothetical protein
VKSSVSAFPSRISIPKKDISNKPFAAVLTFIVIYRLMSLVVDCFEPAPVAIRIHPYRPLDGVLAHKVNGLMLIYYCQSFTNPVGQ